MEVLEVLVEEHLLVLLTKEEAAAEVVEVVDTSTLYMEP
jgi:hypothetical protein